MPINFSQHLKRPWMNSAAPDSPAHLALVRKTLAAWELQAVDIKLVSHAENLVYRADIAGGDSVALRLHRPGYHTRAELRSEQMWTAALNAAGIPVPIGRALPSGDYYQPVTLPGGEKRFAGVVDWLGGVPLGRLLEDMDGRGDIVAHYRTLGGLSANLHNQAAAWKPPADFTRHHLDADGLMGNQPFWGPFWTLPELTPAQRDLVRRARNHLYEQLSALDRSPGSYSMIHADLHAWNLLVDGNNVTVIDFDDAGFGWHTYDMAVSLFSVSSHPRAEKIRDAYVEGYRAERALPAARLERLPAFSLIRALALLGWIHHRREIDRRSQLERLIAMVCAQAETLLR